MNLVKLATPDPLDGPSDPKIGWQSQIALSATPQEVSRCLVGLCQDLLQLGLSIENLFSLELVLAEILNNIVEHAYSDASNGTIQIQVSVHDMAIWCVVQDTGKAMPNAQLPKQPRYDPQDMAVQDLPEGGFGWTLIRDLTHDLKYVRKGNFNKCSFRIDLEPQTV